MRTIFSIFAFTGFYASLLTHLSTFFGVDPSEHFPWIWLLHVGIFAAFIPLVGKDLWRKVLKPFPPWARYAVIAFAIYVPFNFFIFLGLSEGASVDVRDGVYVLHKHGEVVRELTEQEYRRQKAYVVRGFSGHWMLFYLLPALHSWYRKD